jgi:hypothetical protein
MKVLLKNSNDNLLKDEDKLLATSRPDITEYVTKTEFEELVKVSPTDIKRNDNNEIYLSHDGTEISGQTNKVKLPNGFDLFEAESFMTFGPSNSLSAENLANYNKLKYPYAIRVAKGDLSGKTLIGYARALKENNISYYIFHDEQNYFQLELNVSTGSYTWRMYEFNKLDLASYGTLYIKNSSGNFMPYLSMRGITLSNGAMPEHVTIKKTATNYDIINYTYSSVNINQTIGDKTGLTCHVYCSDGYQDLWIYLSDNVWNYVFKDSILLSVNANPTLDGTEEALTSVQIGDKKYKVDSVVPTDINVDSNYNLILEHDGTEISGQKKQVAILPLTYIPSLKRFELINLELRINENETGTNYSKIDYSGISCYSTGSHWSAIVNGYFKIGHGPYNYSIGVDNNTHTIRFYNTYTSETIYLPNKPGTIALKEDFKTINNKSLLITDASDTNINVGADFGAKQWNFTQMDSFKFHFADENEASGADIDIIFPTQITHSGDNVHHLAVEEDTIRGGTGEIQYLAKGLPYGIPEGGDIVGFSYNPFNFDTSIEDNEFYDGLYIGYDNGYYLKFKNTSTNKYPYKEIRSNNDTNQFEFISQNSSTSKSTVKLNVDNDGTLLTSNDISLATINDITSLTESYDGVNRLTVDNKNNYASIKVNDNSNVEYPYTLQDGDKIEIEISTLNGINFTINGKSYSSIGTKEINLNDSNIDISIPSETIDSSPSTYITTIIYHKILGDKIISLGNLATFLATQLSQYSKKQYFDHQITVSDNNNNSYLFHVTSSNNLKCDSPQDLTTLLKPDPEVTRYAVTCINDTIGEVILYATSVGSNIIWKFATGGGDLLLTTVADVVTLI